MSAKYLVTGAAGHLGNTIVRKLVETGHSVRGLVLPDDKIADQLPQEMEIYAGDVTDKQSLHPFFTVDEKDRVILIHSAGIVSIGSKPAEAGGIRDVNVGGTRNILEMCK